MKSSVEYPGHKISAEGIHPLEATKKAIVNAPSPKNVQQLRSYLELLNYYGNFIPSLSTMAHPPYNLHKTERLNGTGIHPVRWALILSAYSYEKPTAAHGNADGLSRLPLPEMSQDG